MVVPTIGPPSGASLPYHSTCPSPTTLTILALERSLCLAAAGAAGTAAIRKQAIASSKRRRDMPSERRIGGPTGDTAPLMRFHDVERAVDGVPFMTPWQGRRIYDHVRATGARDVLELGTAHGASAAYLAAAVAANGGGRVTSVDRFRFEGPTPEETVERAGLTDSVEFVRVPDSSYD